METKPPITPLDQMPDFNNVIDPGITAADEQWLRGMGIGQPEAQAPEAPAQQFDALGRPVQNRFEEVNNAAFGTSRPDFVVGAKSTTPNIDLKLEGKSLEAKMEEMRIMNASKVAAKAAIEQHRNNAFLAAQVLEQQRKQADEDDK